MKYLLVGYLASSLIVSEHADKEACIGREATLKDRGAAVKCVEAPTSGLTFSATSNGTVQCWNTSPVGACR